MEIFIQALIILIAIIPMVVCLLGAFCIMFDVVFGTNLESWLIDNEIIIKGLSIAGMLLILSFPIFIIALNS